MSATIHFISAGAGSGKTYSLTQKLEQLLSSKKVTPAGVIATTFTKLAAGELKERVRGALIEAGQLQVANQMEQSLIGTVNSVCGEILRRFAFEAGMPPKVTLAIPAARKFVPMIVTVSPPARSLEMAGLIAATVKLIPPPPPPPPPQPASRSAGAKARRKRRQEIRIRTPP